MAYQTYITEALVCGNWHRNTADRTILLFSREAGMVYVQAKSVREERSKQRYALQDASHIRATLIRGKAGWRVASAEPLKNFYAYGTTRESRALLRNIILLLRRVMQGETPHQDIFDDVVLVLGQQNIFPAPALEAVFSIRLLNMLGYVSPDATHRHIFETPFPFEILANLSAETLEELKKISEHALIQSQL